MNNRYPSLEKLKSRTLIQRLFSEGKSVSKFPLRLIFVAVDSLPAPIQVGVAVPKKHFKKAVDRNRIKRRLREAYRLNKNFIQLDGNKAYACMITYNSPEALTYQEIESRMQALLGKFSDSVSQAAIVDPVKPESVAPPE
ncbi:MAG: ribonuclease P protein component [Chitinophagaceae bacterium]|nr:MAG: ribonuclease P protein component [Chitinophagaceae bacterium]